MGVVHFSKSTPFKFHDVGHGYRQSRARRRLTASPCLWAAPWRELVIAQVRYVLGWMPFRWSRQSPRRHPVKNKLFRDTKFGSKHFFIGTCTNS